MHYKKEDAYPELKTETVYTVPQMPETNNVEKHVTW